MPSRFLRLSVVSELVKVLPIHRFNHFHDRFVSESFVVDVSFVGSQM
jgi:hypothetical protein